jgi:hypothetical protein
MRTSAYTTVRPRYGFADVVGLLFRESLLMIVIFLVVVTIGTAAVLTLKKSYTATASVYAGAGQEYVYQSRVGAIDPSQVKLKANFPAKPLATAPNGWKLERSEQAPVFRKDVELQPGTTITLSIRPHVLAPDADGSQTFSVGEPGFEAAQGYLQKNTVSSILGTSVAQLDRDSLQLGNAISELHRLLASLPKPPEPANP